MAVDLAKQYRCTEYHGNGWRSPSWRRFNDLVRDATDEDAPSDGAADFGGFLLDRIAALEAEAERSIDATLERAARDLPDGCEIHLGVERGAAWVYWVDRTGDRHQVEAVDIPMAEQFRAALEAAGGGE